MDYNVPVVPQVDPKSRIPSFRGTKQLLDRTAQKAVADWALNQKKLLITDTTMRDAQQSLMATRMRTVDLVKIAPATALYGKDFFSLEMWGGATFDSVSFPEGISMGKTGNLRAPEIPNVMFQMLFRGANAVGYRNYPDNVIRNSFVRSAKSGIDVFRIFDSLNWIQGMEVAIDETLNQGKIAEASICYTGDILDEIREKYT